MTININKIIQESVQDTINQNKSEQILKNNTNVELLETESNFIIFQEMYDPAVASAISAGLGAMNFRNHVRLNEAMSKKGKIAAGLGAAGLGAAGLGTAAGLTALGHGDIGQGYDNAKDALGKAVNKSVRNIYKKITFQNNFKGPGDRGETGPPLPQDNFKGPGDRGEKKYNRFGINVKNKYRNFIKNAKGVDKKLLNTNF